MIGLSVCAREAYKSMKERNVDDGHIFLISRYVVQLISVRTRTWYIWVICCAKTVKIKRNQLSEMGTIRIKFMS